MKLPIMIKINPAIFCFEIYSFNSKYEIIIVHTYVNDVRGSTTEYGKNFKTNTLIIAEMTYNIPPIYTYLFFIKLNMLLKEDDFFKK